MLIFNYDAKPIEDIERKLDNLSLLGLAVVRINMSNVLPSESTTLVDVLAQNPQIVGVGFGVGVCNEVIEPPKTQIFDKSQKFYNCDHVRVLTIHFCQSQSPTIPLPKSLEELNLILSIGKPTGREIGNYLSKVITGKCSPRLKLLHVDNVQDWSGFSLLDKIKEISLDKRRNVDPKLLEILRLGGFSRHERTDHEVVFVRLPDNGGNSNTRDQHPDPTKTSS